MLQASAAGDCHCVKLLSILRIAGGAGFFVAKLTLPSVNAK
jgi:hypothetical protein